MQGAGWWEQLASQGQGLAGEFVAECGRSLEGVEFLGGARHKVVWWVISVNSTVGLAKKFLWVFWMVRKPEGNLFWLAQ